MNRYFLHFFLFKSFINIYCDTENDFTHLLKDQAYFEVHNIQTEDKYFIRVFRFGKNERKEGQPILFIHGIVDSADDFIVNQKQNIGFFLSSQGYDIWLLNVRGNKYSCSHMNLDPEEKPFWDFSFHEMGMYDFPAVLEFITQLTRKKVSIIAHSQGTSTVFVGLSQKPELQNSINKFIALAPIAFFKGIDTSETIYYYLASHNYIRILKLFGINKFAERKINQNFFEKLAIKFFCSLYFNLCTFILKHLTDLEPQQIDMDQMPHFLEHNPSRASTKSLEHFAQLMSHKEEKKFVMFDYGEIENIHRYGQKTPPEYKLSNITIPTYLYHGDKDDLSTMENNTILKAEIKNSKERIFQNWGHLTFLWGKDINPFTKILLQDLQEHVAEILQFQKQSNNKIFLIFQNFQSISKNLIDSQIKYNKKVVKYKLIKLSL